MKWNHLPVIGGVYDQHPKMLDDFMIIHQAKAKAQAKDQARQERKSRAKR